MTAVTVDFRLINSAGHHRQPRTGPTWTALPGGYLTDSTPGTTAQATAGAVPNATFLFWSASDGEGGAATESVTINQTVGANPLTLTAWYLPTGGDGTGGPAVLLDAFSLSLGDFVDDDFVVVTSDPALTSQANVAGVVPTGSAQTLDALTTVLNPDLPRSLANCMNEVVTNLSHVTSDPKSESARQAGRLRADVQYGRIGDILSTGLHAWLTQFLDRVNVLGSRISQEFLLPQA